MRLVILACVFLFSGSDTNYLAHPLKMSFSKLDINSKGVIDLQSRIFLDDITAQMQELHGLQEVDFSTVDSDGTKALQQYLTSHYYFEQRGKKIELRINAVSFSTNRLALVLQMSTDAPLDLTKEVFLTNTVLCEASEKQKNDILHLDKHYLLSLTNPRVKIELK
ncbi:MAG: hypothetical protein K9G41_10230 [Flavobacteriales bacterium]|nr:hypothetical protein [Flavobacteriales bacterium]